MAGCAHVSSELREIQAETVSAAGLMAVKLDDVPLAREMADLSLEEWFRRTSDAPQERRFRLCFPAEVREGLAEEGLCIPLWKAGEALGLAHKFGLALAEPANPLVFLHDPPVTLPSPKGEKKGYVGVVGLPNGDFAVCVIPEPFVAGVHRFAAMHR